MVSAKDALEIYGKLRYAGIVAWITGGWGIDALLGRQTREHKDIDLLVEADKLKLIMEMFAAEGYTLWELWSENSWMKDDTGNKIPTAFVLRDEVDRQIDLHGLYFDEEGRGHPAWNDDEKRVFAARYFTCEGIICDKKVKCITKEMQLLAHSGYELPDYQVRDLAYLRGLIDNKEVIKLHHLI